MNKLCFRQEPTCRVWVPRGGEQQRCQQVEQALLCIQNAIKRGDSLSVKHDGVAGFSDKTGQALLVQSAGSSGTPKTIRRSPRSWIKSFEISRREFGLGRGDRFAVLGALQHSLTLYATLEALHLGADLLALSPLRPRHQVEALKAHDVSVLYATPTQLRMLVKTEPAQLNALRWVFCGGGLLDDATRDAFQICAPHANIRAFFGASETSFITMTDPDTPTGSVGRAYFGVDLRIGAAPEIAGDRQTQYATTDPGEIWVKSPYVFEGYATGNNPFTRYKDGYLSIGEIGRLDQKGNLFLMGRLSRMVSVSDQNVFPEAIEAHMQSLAGTRKIAVTMIADTLRGHVIVAVIEGQKDAALAQKIMESCRATLGLNAIPRRVEFVAHIPMLDAGKIDYTQLTQIVLDNA